jgi:hypothetical protein
MRTIFMFHHRFFSGGRGWRLNQVRGDNWGNFDTIDSREGPSTTIFVEEFCGSVATQDRLGLQSATLHLAQFTKDFHENFTYGSCHRSGQRDPEKVEFSLD